MKLSQTPDMRGDQGGVIFASRITVHKLFLTNRHLSGNIESLLRENLSLIVEVIWRE